MKTTHILYHIVLILSGFAMWTDMKAEAPLRHRLIILADMGNEPDEEQQMAHMLMCANEFDLEGLIAVTGKYLHPDRKDPYRQVVHPELFTSLIDAYAQILPNLKLHAKGWPEAAYLHNITAEGQAGYGIEDTGEGKSSEGSELILKALEREDPRPIWVVVNAGSNTLAQALLDYEQKHGSVSLEEAVAKLRVFENGAQDNSGAWICSTYPKIHWIRSNYQTYAYGGPGGMDGDIHSSTFDRLGPWYWKPYAYSPEGQNDWLREHVMTGHGVLGERFPERNFGGGYAFMEGGGTIPWMGLVNKGLFDVDQPSWGGWGGRFSREKVACFWSRHAEVRMDEEKVSPFYTFREVSDTWYYPEEDRLISGEYVPVWRWRKAMYNDLKCRMDWCVEAYGNANHHPVAVLNGDTSDRIMHVSVLPGQLLSLDASGSRDPDGDSLGISWWQYMEAGSYAGQVYIESPEEKHTSLRVPSGAAGKEIHIILEVHDLNELGELHDYRRLVIRVEDQYDHINLFRQKH